MSPVCNRPSASSTNASLFAVPDARLRSSTCSAKDVVSSPWPEVHRHAGGGLQRHRQLTEAVAERHRLLQPALGVGLLAERRPRPVERCRAPASRRTGRPARGTRAAPARPAAPPRSAARPQAELASSVCIISIGQPSPHLRASASTSSASSSASAKWRWKYHTHASSPAAQPRRCGRRAPRTGCAPRRAPPGPRRSRRPGTPPRPGSGASTPARARRRARRTAPSPGRGTTRASGIEPPNTSAKPRTRRALARRRSSPRSRKISIAASRSTRAAARSPCSCDSVPSRRRASPSSIRSPLGDGGLQHRVASAAGGGEQAPLGLGRRPAPAAARRSTDGLGAVRSRAPGWRGGWPRRSGRSSSAPPRRLEQRVDGVVDDRRATPGTGPDLDEQLGRGRRVVGDVVDAGATRRQHRGDAGVALRPHPLGQCLVRHLAHDVAAELPDPPVDLEQAGRRPARRGRRGRSPGPSPWRTWPERRSSPRWPSTAALSRIARCGRSSWSRRAAIRARSEPGRSAPLPQSAASAASSVRNSGLPPPRSTSGSTISVVGCVPAERRSTPGTTASSPTQRSERQRTMSGRSTGGGQSMSASGRCAVTISNGRSTSERATTAEQVAQQRVGPLQVVDPRRRSSCGAGRAGGASPRPPRRRRRGRRRRRPGRAATDGRAGGAIDSTYRCEHRRRRRCSPHTRAGLRLDDPAHLVGGDVGSSPNSDRDARDHRRPRVELAVRRARPCARRSTSPSQPLDHLVDQPGLADAGLADDRHDPAVPVAHDLVAASSSARSLIRPTNGMSDRRAGRRRRDAPVTSHDCSTCSRPRSWVIAERLAVDRRRAQRGGGVADQHTARRRQRLQPGGRVHDVAHRRVVGAGERADEHLAGVDADAHPDVGHAVDGRPLAATNRASVSCIRSARARPARRRPRGRPARRTGRRWRRRAPCRPARRRPRCRRRGARSRRRQALDVLRIEVLGERRVPDDVGEQHRDDAPFLRRRPAGDGAGPARRAEAGPRRHRIAARGAARRMARMLRRHGADATGCRFRAAYNGRHEQRVART